MRCIRLCWALLAVAAIAGCGSSGSGVSAGRYMSSVCTAIGPWVSDVSVKTRQLDLSSKASPQDRKAVTERFLDAVVADSQRAVSQIKAAGTPNINNGKAVAATIVSGFEQLSAAMLQARVQAAKLPTSSEAAFNAATQSLSNSVTGSVSQLGSLRNPELEKAAARQAACQQLGAA